MPDHEELQVDITKNPGDTQDEVVELASNESADDSELNNDSQDTDGEDTTSQDEKEAPKPRSNKSNFKKLAKSNKAKDKKIAELEAKLSEKSEDVSDEDDNDDDDTEDTPTYDKVDLLEFLTDTPGSIEYKEGIKEALDEFPGISFEKALNYVKAQAPETSKSHSKFSTKSWAAAKTKKLKNLSAKEAASADLTPEQFDTWQNSQSKESNPFS